MALAVELLGDRWTMLILREAFYGVERYDDMRKDLGAPRSMLSDRLGKMVENGLMTRRTYQEPGLRARSAYVLTEAGRDLALTLMALSQWGEKYALKDDSPIVLKDKRSGDELRVGLVDRDGKLVEMQNVRMHLNR